MRRLPLIRLAAIALAGLLIAGACSSVRSSAGKGRLRVVAAENFWGDVVAQIGGDHVAVSSILSDPNADPHEYESSAANAKDVALADVIVMNGLGYDDFMNKLLEAGGGARQRVVEAAQVMGISGADANPHVWYDIARVPAVADAIAAALGRADQKDAATFRARAQGFTTSLLPITDVITTIKERYAGASVAYTERVPGYLVDAAGLRLGTPASFARSIEDGNDPSAADTSAFDSAITSRSVRVLLYNAQVTDAQTEKIKSLAMGSRVPVVGVTETLPNSDKDFQDWQLRQARELLTALGGTT
ncbi:MAG: zinc ABC transporter substrate-binding protein [Actinobacteria bacterium]|nr:zinc ABC transporter substrate-binding protein [Actinomycetota bacterium]